MSFSYRQSKVRWGSLHTLERKRQTRNRAIHARAPFFKFAQQKSQCLRKEKRKDNQSVYFTLLF